MAPIPLIIDTDPGVDDILAILLALASPEFDIKAITINFGNTDADSSYTNILKLWKVLEDHCKEYPNEFSRFHSFAPNYAGEYPVLAQGSKEPLQGEAMYAGYFHGIDGLSDITDRHPEFTTPAGWRPQTLKLTDEHAVDVTLDIIRAYPPRSVTYIALGPLTNLARVMEKDSKCFQERIGRVVIMGGSVDAPGNTTAVAEFNFYADPFAVHELLHPKESNRGLPLDRTILVPLDLTTRIALPFKIYKDLVDPAFESTAAPSKKEGKKPLVHFTSSFLEKAFEVMRGFGANVMELHDPTAIWCAMCNHADLGETTHGPNAGAGWKLHKRVFQVERYGEHTRGMLVVDRREVSESHYYQLGANRAKVFGPVAADPPVQVESGEQVDEALMKGVEGVPVVVECPGATEMVQLLLERIWGVSLI